MPGIMSENSNLIRRWSAEADSLIPILNSASVANFLLWTPAFVSGRQFKSTSWFYDVSKKEKKLWFKIDMGKSYFTSFAIMIF